MTTKHTVTIARLRKADNAEIRVTLDHYKGRRVVDLRVWYVPDGGAEYVPTRKGVTLDADKLAPLVAALGQAANQHARPVEPDA